MQRGWSLDGLYFLSEESRGLGFDVSTSIFKMVCVLLRRDCSKFATFGGSISTNLCTMVHVLGMDSSWREIPEVPPYPTSGDGIFAHGCLYWQSSSQEHFICFDVRNEEFTLIHRPKRRCGYSVTYHQLVDLQGEVGYAYFYRDDIIEVWVLKQNQWANHCQFNIIESLGPISHLKVLGGWSKDGDILIENDVMKKLLVYSLKSRLFGEVSIVGQEYGFRTYMYMYPA
ncbi:F-box domain containing protein, partial [Tanacetum coccineum]